MVLWLSAEVLEDRLFPITFHVVPVVDLAMANWVVNSVSWRLCIGKGLIAYEEVEVFDSSLRGETARLCRHCRSRSAGLSGRSASRDGCWEYANGTRQK